MVRCLQFSLFLITIGHFSTAFGQNNTGFENWVNLGGIEVPENWATLNALVISGSDTSCTKYTNAHSGDFAALIHPIYFDFIDDTISGILTQSDAIQYRPDSFCIFYQYSGSHTDSAFIQVDFYKEFIHPNQIIGSAVYYFKNQITWSQACSSIDWQSSDQPDSVLIHIWTSNNNKRDSLIVDDFGFVNPVSINNMKAEKLIPILYYNQENNEIVFNNVSIASAHKIVTIRNQLGQALMHIETGQKTIGMDKLPAGIYIVELQCNGRWFFQKIIIAR